MAKRRLRVASESLHDYFLQVAAGGYYQQKTAYSEECQGIKPELGEAGAAGNDAARDVDVLCSRFYLDAAICSSETSGLATKSVFEPLVERRRLP